MPEQITVELRVQLIVRTSKEISDNLGLSQLLTSVKSQAHVLLETGYTQVRPVKLVELGPLPHTVIFELGEPRVPPARDM